MSDVVEQMLYFIFLFPLVILSQRFDAPERTR